MKKAAIITIIFFILLGAAVFSLPPIILSRADEPRPGVTLTPEMSTD